MKRIIAILGLAAAAAVPTVVISSLAPAEAAPANAGAAKRVLVQQLIAARRVLAARNKAGETSTPGRAPLHRELSVLVVARPGGSRGLAS